MLSVVMPAYNAAKYIKYSIDSILNQTFKQFELLIYDDASTDSTRSIIKRYVYQDPRVRLYYGNKNIRQAEALNYLIAKTKYNFVALNDSDDISKPMRFLKQIMFLNNNKKCGAVGTFANIIDENSIQIRKITYPTSSTEIKKQIGKINCFAQSSMMIRKKKLFQAGKFNKLLDPAQDYDMWCRLSLISKLTNINEFLIDYREHTTSSSSLRKEESFYKSEFIKVNYNYLKKNRDLIKLKNISKIDKEVFYSLFSNRKKFIKKIELELKFAFLGKYYKEKKIINFIYNFINLLFTNLFFLLKKIKFFIIKTYKY
jgi:glycosyltransferase involved in cell wall biosynthesis